MPSPVVDADRLTLAEWEAGFSAYKDGRAITAVQKAAKVGFALAKVLVKEGVPSRNWPSYEDRLRAEEEYEMKVKEALVHSKVDERLEYLKYSAMYRHLVDNTENFFKTNGKSGMEPKPALVRALSNMLELSETLKKMQREMLNMIVLPFDDMSEDELAQWARGKKKPRR